jgi:hypothetical protein
VPCHQALLRNVQSWRAVSNGQFTYVKDELGEEIALYNDETDAFQMNNIKDDVSYELEKAKLERALDSFVIENDGYVEWDILLERFGLLPEWDKSQTHFEEAWHVKMPSRRNEIIAAHRDLGSKGQS